MPKKLDDILNPKPPDPPDPPEPPDAAIRGEILEKLRAAKGNPEGECLHLGELLADHKIPPVGQGGIATLLVLGMAYPPTLKKLVEEGLVGTKKHEGLDYYWLPGD